MRPLYVPLFIGLVFAATTANGGVISSQTSISFEDGLTDQLDRLNVGFSYERLSWFGNSDRGGFWDDCDSPDADGISVSRCSFRSESYILEADVSGVNGWSELGPTLTSNISDIQGDSLFAVTESEGRGGSSSSLSGSFGIGFSEVQIGEILTGHDQGIRLSYGFSWIGFGLLDDFDGVMGQWASLPVMGHELLPAEFVIRSSLRTRVTATSTDYSLQLAEDPRVIVDEIFTGAGEGGMTFSPDLASYGFTSGDIVSFSVNIEQRLWTERTAKVPEPGSMALLLTCLIGLGLIRSSSKPASTG